MKSLLKMIGASTLGFAALAASVMMTPSAYAIDKVVLKDGRTVEGEVVREQDGVVWLKTAGGTVMYTPSEYSKVEKGASDSPDAGKTDAKSDQKTDATAAPATTDGSKPRKSGTPRAAVVTYGDEENGNMVGIYCTAASFREAMKYLEDEKVDIVVVRFKSGGGLGLEVQKFSDLFHLEYKPKFRLVAWIDSAISAAAMSAHSIEEIYFTPQGNYGACTGFYGASLVAVKGRELEKSLYEMEKISARGGYHPQIMRAMQISSEVSECEPLQIAPPTGALSADVDEDTGKVTWYADKTTGKYCLNPNGGVHILTFNSETATKFKFSKGTAANVDELAKAMGLTEVEWVGKQDKRFTWPICKAEEYMLKFRVQTKTDEAHFRRYISNFAEALGRSQAEQDPNERGKFLGKAREALGQIENMVRNNSNWILLNWGTEDEYKEWLERMKKIIKELAKR